MSTGAVNSAQAALAGLATAIGVTGFVFPGFAGGAARKRLRQAATSDSTSHGGHDGGAASHAASHGGHGGAAGGHH